MWEGGPGAARRGGSTSSLGLRLAVGVRAPPCVGFGLCWERRLVSPAGREAPEKPLQAAEAGRGRDWPSQNACYPPPPSLAPLSRSASNFQELLGAAAYASVTVLWKHILGRGQQFYL